MIELTVGITVRPARGGFHAVLTWPDKDDFYGPWRTTLEQAVEDAEFMKTTVLQQTEEKGGHCQTEYLRKPDFLKVQEEAK